jgi:hypothetical protein
VNRTERGPTGAVAVYRHVYAAGETTYTWTTSFAVGGSIFAAAFAGVDSGSPIDVAAGGSAASTASITAPSVTTAYPGDLLLASFYGHRTNATSGSWTPPTGMTEIADLSNGGSRSGSLAYAGQATAGATGDRTGTASAVLDYGIGVLLALHPAGTRAIAVPPATEIVFDGATSATYASDATTS